MARILVVDDHAHVRGAVRRILAKAGHEIWDAPDGTEALALLDVIDFDLIITDVYMTAVDGMELLMRSHERGCRAPVIVMSGGGYAPRGELLKLARSCGAFATIVKPFSPQELRALVQSVLEVVQPAM